MGDFHETGSSRSLPQSLETSLQAIESRASSTAGRRSASRAGPFLCEADNGCGCGMSFGREADRSRHIREALPNSAYVCEDCEDRRKCYIFRRDQHLESHITKVHKGKRPKYGWRNLSEEERANIRNARHRRTSSAGAAGSLHRSSLSAAPSQALGGASSDVSRSAVPHSSHGKRSRASTSPGPPTTMVAKDSNILYGDSGSEHASKIIRRLVGTRAEAGESSRTGLSASEPDLAGEDLKSLFIFPGNMSSRTVPTKTVEWLEEAWETTETRPHPSNSSSGRSSRSTHRPVRSGAIALVKPHGQIPESVGNFLDTPVRQDHWNHMHPTRQGEQREVIVISDDDL